MGTREAPVKDTIAHGHPRSPGARIPSRMGTRGGGCCGLEALQARFQPLACLTVQQSDYMG